MRSPAGSSGLVGGGSGVGAGSGAGCGAGAGVGAGIGGPAALSVIDDQIEGSRIRRSTATCDAAARPFLRSFFSFTPTGPLEPMMFWMRLPIVHASGCEMRGL